MHKVEVIVKTYAILRELIGKKEVRLEFDNIVTLREIIYTLSNKFNEKIKKLLLDKEGKLKKDFVVLKDGVRIKEIDEKISENVILLIFPPFSGGGDSICGKSLGLISALELI